jgi:transcriptional regulator with XRE-family HTH domain
MAESKPGNTRLRRLRVELKRTQEEIVGDLRARADRMRASGHLSKRVDFSIRQYSKWEGPKPPWPHPETRIVLEEFFQRSMSDLGFTSPYDEESAAPGEVVPFIPRSPVIEVAPPGSITALAGPMDDRSLPWLTSPGLGSGGSSEWRIGETEVELLRAAADDMDAIDQQFGGNRLWRPTRAHLLWVHQMIDRGIYDEELGRQLHTVAGKFTTSLGWFCYDAGLQAEARYYFSEALNTANFTGDDALACRTLSNMARQAVDLNKGREAVRFARLAQAHAKEWAAPPRVAALLAVREAQGHARLGDRLSCEASIRRAWQDWERGRDERDPDWTTFLNEAELVCLEGMCRLDLGQSDRAQKLLARSEKLQDIAHSRNRGMCLGRLSVAAMENRDLGHSVDAAAQSLHLIKGGMSSTRAVQQLKIVQGGLDPHHRSREVRDLLEQISEYIA